MKIEIGIAPASNRERLIERNTKAAHNLVTLLGLFCASSLGVVFFLVWGSDFRNPAHAFLTGFSLGVLLATGLSYFFFRFGPAILANSFRARRLDEINAPVLSRLNVDLSARAGIPPPWLYVIEDPSPNIFSAGRSPESARIFVTDGLFAKLSDDELEAVMAHEICHISHGDSLLMTMLAVYAGVVVLLTDLLLGSVCGFGKGRVVLAATLPSKMNPALGILFIVLGFALSLVTPVVVLVLQLAWPRSRDYLIDAMAAKLCGKPSALASALRKIALDPNVLQRQNRAAEHLFIVSPNPKRRLQKADHDSPWYTHPPIMQRVQRLKALEKSLAVAPEAATGKTAASPPPLPAQI